MTLTTDDKPDTDDPDTEAADTTDESTEAAVAEADTPAERRWARRLRTGSLAVVSAGIIGAAGLLGWTVWQQHRLNDAGQQAQAAAVAYAQILTSIDSNAVDDNFTKVLDGSTGEFKDMYSQSSMQLRQLLIDNKASAHGVVVESAVQSVTKDKVVVLLFVDQSVSNTSVPDPRIDRSRIKMTMDHVDGRWRAAKVELP